MRLRKNQLRGIVVQYWYDVQPVCIFLIKLLDNGMHIPDDSSFTFRTSPILRRIIASRKGRQEIRFAFAVEKSTALLKSRQFPSKRSLANVHFTDTRWELQTTYRQMLV